MTPVASFAREHPRLSAWALLAVVMNLILAVTARDVGLTAVQWLALIVVTTLVAGACVWLVGGAETDEGREAKREERGAKNEE